MEKIKKGLILKIIFITGIIMLLYANLLSASSCLREGCLRVPLEKHERLMQVLSLISNASNDVMPDTEVLIFDMDHFITWPLTDLSAEELNEIILGKKEMPNRYKVSLLNKILLEKFLQRRGILVVISGADINNILLRVVNVFPENLRKQIIAAHCGGKQVYTCNEQGMLNDEPAIDFVKRFFEARGIDGADRIRFDLEWMKIVDSAIEFFSLDSDTVFGHRLDKVRIDRRYDKPGNKGHIAQVTFEFDERFAALEKLDDEEKTNIIVNLNKKIIDFNALNPHANIPTIASLKELRNPLEQYLRFFYGEIGSDKRLPLAELGFAQIAGALDTGIGGINKKTTVTSMINEGLIERILGKRLDGSKILVGEDTKSSLLGMIDGISEADSKKIDNPDKARGLLAPNVEVLDSDSSLVSYNGRITVINNEFGPACFGVTRYIISSLMRRGGDLSNYTLGEVLGMLRAYQETVRTGN